MRKTFVTVIIDFIILVVELYIDRLSSLSRSLLEQRVRESERMIDRERE
jgi:hypothetical protein